MHSAVNVKYVFSNFCRIYHVIQFFILAVPSVVLSQRSHENHRYKANQKDHIIKLLKVLNQ